jgi:hypothetical protein
MKPHRGVLILVLGILSFFGCSIFTAIPAWVMGNADLKDMDAGTMDPAGRGMTQAGKILGIIAVVLAALSIVAIIVLMALGVLAGVAGQK